MHTESIQAKIVSRGQMSERETSRKTTKKQAFHFKKRVSDLFSGKIPDVPGTTPNRCFVFCVCTEPFNKGCDDSMVNFVIA